MKRTKDQTKATLERPSDTTGRDGAIDLIAKVESSAILNQSDDDRFTRVMGSAVIDLWGTKEIQERLFERAVALGHQSERDAMLREQLAKYLTTTTSELRGCMHKYGQLVCGRESAP